MHVRYSAPTLADKQNKRCDSEGVIDAVLLRSLLTSPRGEFYFCGPRAMMSLLYGGLLAWGVKPEQMRYEFFGPAQELAAPANPPAPALSRAVKPCCGTFAPAEQVAMVGAAG